MVREERLASCVSPSDDPPLGEVVGGVAILTATRPYVGVADPSLKAADLEHRLLGLRLKLPGMDAFLVASAYLQAGGGLGRINRTALATLARWQDEAKLPILVGGDFNLSPDKVLETDFASRSGTQVVAPSSSTYRTAKARTKIDYFIISSCLSNKIQGCQTLEGVPT